MKIKTQIRAGAATGLYQHVSSGVHFPQATLHV